MINTLYLDMDGVIADFLKAFGDLHGYDISAPPSWEVYELMDMTKDEFYKELNSTGHDFWINIPVTKHGNELVSVLENFGIDTYICSSPPNSPGSWSGKKQWIQNHFPQYSSKIILTHHKHLLAKEHTVLIDDSQKNIDKFRRHGGKAIAYPATHNEAKKYDSDPLKHVVKMIINYE